MTDVWSSHPRCLSSNGLIAALLLLTLPATTRAEAVTSAAERPDWREGQHATGEWGGARAVLEKRGVTLDLVYTAELFANVSALTAARPGVTALGHVDAAVTLDSDKLGLWRGGTLYALVQNSHGSGINTRVGSANEISNLEAPALTQVTELFYEQAWADDLLHVRLGKQDANREFGTPRYAGNLINNNFGMFPAAPLPSYPTTGLGATVIVQPTGWMALKACLFEGNPTLGSFGFDSAFVRGAGFMVASEVAATHHSQAALGDVGTTSVGAWRQQGDFPELTGVGARVFKSDFGFFIQNDERVLAHPANPERAAGLNVITRFAWAQADRTNVDLYAGASVVWHGLGPRADDTVGAGAGGFRVRHPLGGTRGPGTELFFEAFYKWRLTRFLSLQPDVELYRHPGGDGSNAVVVGARLKVKL